MPLTESRLVRFSFVVVFVGVLPALGSDQDVRAEVQHALATPYATEDPGVAAFTLKLDLRITNQSPKQVNLPRAQGGDAGATRIAVLGVQALQHDGAWQYVVQSSWYDTGGQKYGPCAPLASGGAAVFGGVSSGLLLLKTQLAGLSRGPTVRLDLMFFCRQPDGKVLTTSVTTNGFVLNLSAQPDK